MTSVEQSTTAQANGNSVPADPYIRGLAYTQDAEGDFHLLAQHVLPEARYRILRKYGLALPEYVSHQVLASVLSPQTELQPPTPSTPDQLS